MMWNVLISLVTIIRLINMFSHHSSVAQDTTYIFIGFLDSHLKLCIHEHTAYALRHSHAGHKRRVLINFQWTWGEQRTPGAWKGHSAHPVLLVFVQKTDKFWFVANSMRTIRGWRRTGSQSLPHIRAFGLRTVRKWFAKHYLAHSCILGLRAWCV